VELRPFVGIEIAVESEIVVTGYDDFGFEVGFLEPGDGFGELRVGSLVSEVAGVDEHVAFWE
jgi:hypothetical protein